MKNLKYVFLVVLVLLFMSPLQVFASANRFASVVSTDKASAPADGVSYVKFTVYAYDATNNPVPGTDIIVASNRSNCDIFTNINNESLSQAPQGLTPNYIVSCDDNGKAEFKVKSTTPGVANIGVGLIDNPQPTSLYDYLIGNSGVSSSDVEIISSTNITFTSPSPSLTIENISVKKDSTVIVPINGASLSMASGQLKVTYDSSVISLTDISKGEALSSFLFEYNLETNPEGYVRISFANSNNISINGEICSLQFRVDGEKGDSTQICIDPESQLFTETGSDISVNSIENGLLIVLNIGDANRDGSINAADATCILRIVDGLISVDDDLAEIADINKDGEITTEDAVLILKYIVGLISQIN